MRSEPYHDELHTFRGDTEQRRHRRNGGSSCAMDERRCRHDMMMRVTLLNDLFCFAMSELFFHLHLLFAVELSARRVYSWTVRSNVVRCSNGDYIAQTRFGYLRKLSPQLGIVTVFVICFTIRDSRITWVDRGNNRVHTEENVVSVGNVSWVTRSVRQRLSGSITKRFPSPSWKKSMPKMG